MTSIKLRFVIINSLLVLLVFIFSYLLVDSYSQYVRSKNRHLLSYEIQSLITSNKSNSEINKKISNYLTEIDNLNRLTLLKKYIKDKSYKNTIIQNEFEFRRYLFKKVKFYQSKVNYYLIFLIFTLLLIPIISILFINQTVFKQLKVLSKKMSDFVNGEYSYEFSLPEENEIGQVQQNFNLMAQQVLKQMDELKSLDRAKSEFLSIASHELRTPLTSIKGSLGLLNSGATEDFNENTLNLINIAETETDRLIRLINDILDLAKIEAKKFPLKKDWSSINKAIETTVESLSGLADTAKIILHAEINEDLEAYIDTDRIQQILTNLVSNAIKHSPENETVTVSCEICDDKIYIKVIDHGEGISPEDQELIFEKFRQAINEDNPLVKGTGLGLSIAKALVEEHEGELALKSIPNEGSTFYFYLPQWRYTDSPEREAS